MSDSIFQTGSVLGVYGLGKTGKSVADFLNKKSTPQGITINTPQGITINDDCDISSSCVVAADLAARVAFLEKTPESEALELLGMYVTFLKSND